MTDEEIQADREWDRHPDRPWYRGLSYLKAAYGDHKHVDFDHSGHGFNPSHDDRRVQNLGDGGRWVGKKGTHMTIDTSQFTGTDHWYRHGLNPLITYTDGVRYVAETAQAYWLLDEIAFAPVRGEFQVWKLTVADNKADLVCEDGNDNVIFSKKIAFTDYPDPSLTLWLVGGVILLPSEY